MSLINIFEVFKIGVSIWDLNILFGGFEESFDGLLFEEVLVLGEFVGEFIFSLGEDWSLTSGLSSVEFGSEDGDSIESVLVLFELLDEELVGLTSGDVELDELGSNGGKSVIDPFKMVVGVLDLGLNPFSVLGGIFSDFSVSVGNSSEIGDGLSTVDLLLSPTSVMIFLFFIDRILKFEKELFDGVDSITSHGVG